MHLQQTLTVSSCDDGGDAGRAGFVAVAALVCVFCVPQRGVLELALEEFIRRESGGRGRGEERYSVASLRIAGTQQIAIFRQAGMSNLRMRTRWFRFPLGCAELEGRKGLYLKSNRND